MNEKLKLFEIELEDIENVDFENGMIQKIARKYSDEYDLKRLELVLNENIITAKDKFTGIHSYMGMKISLEPLEKNISFIVRPTSEPTYAELQQENQQLKEELKKLKQPTIFIDTQDIEERYGEGLYMDYLEEENQQLKDDLEKEQYLVDKYTRQLTDEYKNTKYQCKEKEKYKSRIDKAIEYIEDKMELTKECPNELLEILKGSDNNE